MSELTVITTVEITDILRNVSEGHRMDKKEWVKVVPELIKSTFNCDDVVVTNIQEFETDFNNIDWETEWHELRRQMEVKEAELQALRKKLKELLED